MGEAITNQLFSRAVVLMDGSTVRLRAVRTDMQGTLLSAGHVNASSEGAEGPLQASEET